MRLCPKCNKPMVLWGHGRMERWRCPACFRIRRKDYHHKVDPDSSGAPSTASHSIADDVTPYLQDPDLALYHGDCLEVLRQLPDESVDCCVTSPPYFGLRDYGTGSWEGGDEECDHLQKVGGTGASTLGAASGGNDMSDEARERSTTRSYVAYRDRCAKCGATRTDQQLGLEPTPDQFVAAMVEVFQEVRRVLASHGTAWVNLGDSYATQRSSGSLKAKDLIGIPWRVAFALQQGGWWLRSDVIWEKPNALPESINDRPTKSHEYIFMLTKQARYWFDSQAVRERYAPPLEHSRYAREKDHDASIPQRETLDGSEGEAARGPDGRRKTIVQAREGSIQHRDGERWPNPDGRNIRSVWTIPTQPYKGAHFATMPEELARRCIVAGCPERVCRECGKPSERIVKRDRTDVEGWAPVRKLDHSQGAAEQGNGRFGDPIVETLGWTDCGHDSWRRGVVLDPFAGSGTTLFVARNQERHSIGIELNQSYLQLAAERLGQQSLFSEAY